MKTVSVRDLQKTVRECVEAAQKDRIVITRHGRPAAVLVGVEGTDWETVILETNADFWRLIEKRRKQSTVSLAEMRKRVGTRSTSARQRARR
ncbi:MAG: type II toxin-antitoxin system Phd/YefM family antitoxin [Nitrospiraceae bacterium]